ncbi:MAG: pyridoxal 5'-phosphate synthase glutaminase subunit PdxT [Thermoleophilaceae bacterium]
MPAVVGVLALQGDFEAHARVLGELGAEARAVRTPADLEGLDGLIIPGGESTTMTLGVEREGLAEPLRALAAAGAPVLGTCAGLIMLDREHLGILDVSARRNAFGRQIQSFEVDLGPGRPRRRTSPRTATRSARCSSAPRGSRSTARASRCWPRWTATRWRFARTTCSPWPSTPRSPASGAFTAGSSSASPSGARRRRAPGEGPAGGGPRRDPRPVLHARGGGRRLRHPVLDRRRAARAGGLRGGPAGRRPAGPLADHRGRERPRCTTSPRTISSTGSLRRPGGPPRRPTCASRSWPTRTRASSRRSTRARQQRTSRARKPLMETVMRRAAAGEHRWSLTLFPTHAYAAEAGMSLAAYEDFYYAACLATDEDPVTAWQRQSDEVRRLAEWIQGREEVRITGPGTDITLNVSGRTWVPCVGEHNMPDGEFFTGPLEDSATGEVSYSFPASYGGREVAGVRLRFEEGRVVDASAERGEAFLIETLDTDDGARRLGELGIGTNYGIATGTKEILLDEKIGGTVHLAIGMSYPETGGVNESAVHWDMVCDLRQGGSVVGGRRGAPARRAVRGLSGPGSPFLPRFGPDGRPRSPALVLWALSGLFLARVLGQVLVVFAGVEWLPAAGEWYSGLLPYPLLLPAQVVILGLMARINLQAGHGRGYLSVRRPRLGRALLAVAGGVRAGDGRPLRGVRPAPPRAAPAAARSHPDRLSLGAGRLSRGARAARPARCRQAVTPAPRDQLARGPRRRGPAVSSTGASTPGRSSTCAARPPGSRSGSTSASTAPPRSPSACARPWPSSSVSAPSTAAGSWWARRPASDG